MNTYLGGGQTPLIRGLLRAAVIRSRFSGTVISQFNDTDIASKSDVGSALAGPEVRAGEPKKAWLPLVWEYPFQGPPASTTRKLYLPHRPNLTIAGLRLGSTSLGDLMVEETIRELAWAENCAGEVLDDAAGASSRARVVAELARQRIGGTPNLGGYWDLLGRQVLSGWLRDVETTTLSGELLFNPSTATEPAFGLLQRCLEQPDAFMSAFLEASGNLEGDRSKLPFYVVTEEGGEQVRSELVLRGGVLYVGAQALGSAAGFRYTTNLAQVLAQRLGATSVVPKVLPLIVSLRQRGVIYLSDPPYLDRARKLAQLLQVPQHEMLSVAFDLSQAYGRATWRSLLKLLERSFGAGPAHSGWYGAVTYDARPAYQRASTAWSKNPTLLFLWVVGGEELIGRVITTAKLKTIR